MKKRKVLAVLLSLVLIISTLGGCAQGTAYTAYRPGDQEWPEKNMDNYVAPSEASVTFNGKTYTGSYSKTTYSLEATCPIVFYRYTGNGFWFTIDGDTGILREINLDYPEDRMCTFNEEHGRNVADALADDYISLEKNTVKCSVLENPHRHKYRYGRDINGFATTGGVQITLNCKGEVCRFSQGMDFENVKSVDIDEEQVKKAVEKRYEDWTSPFGKIYSRCEIGSMMLTKTHTNQCALYCMLKLYAVDENGFETVEGIDRALVVVDHQKFNPFKP